jgi:hypothetical protein
MMLTISDKAVRLAMLDSLLQQDLLRKAKAERRLAEMIEVLLEIQHEVDKTDERIQQTIKLMDM